VARVAADPVREVVEICLRCGTQMEWRHGTFQCPRCRFKIGCCEGKTGDCEDA
jgi:tRNA(Ile2) C34 agmatinyltransferase TiaS